MKSKNLLPVLLALPVVGMAQKKNTPPNVVVILADDIGYGDLGWLGSKTIHTPNVNKLADEGIRFTNCHTTSATSTPSRYALFTGMYPWRKAGTGVATGDAAMIIAPEQYTMADMFKNAGYVTGAVGKWHLGLGSETGKQNWNGVISPALTDIGFDYSFILAATGDRVPCVYIENGKVVNLDPADPIEVSYKKPFEGEPLGKNNPELLRLHFTHGHDQAIVDGIPRIGYMRGGMKARWHDENIADDITEKALHFIDTNKNKPFFLYFGTNDIHVPRVPHQRFVGASGMGPRGDAIVQFDYCVGRVMKTLDSLGIADNTIIVLSSDNGPVIEDGYKDQAEELLGNHKAGGVLRGSKYSIFEAGTRVPCIVRWKKGIPKPASSTALISQVDFLASFAALVGQGIPAGSAPDSQNQLKALIGKAPAARTYLVEQNLSTVLAVTDGVWKYIEPTNAPDRISWNKAELGHRTAHQLYNLKDDAGETNNVADKHPEIVDKMSRILKKERDMYSYK